MAKFIDGERLSWPHFVLLREAIRRKVIAASDINDGRRTMAEQQQRVDEKGVWSPSNPTGAALPHPDAPHIWRGRTNHALDIQTTVVLRLMEFYRMMGVPCVRNVPGEAWHVAFPDEMALERAAASLLARGGLLMTLKPGDDAEDVRVARTLLWMAGENPRIPKTNKNHYGESMARTVRHFQRKHGLVASGTIGSTTWKKLKQEAHA